MPDYYFSTTVKMSFPEALEEAKEALKNQGFGVLREIDVKAILKKKLDVEFRNYVILGACNPSFAYEALRLEDKIGTMLPGNVVVRETQDGRGEIAAGDPIASMQAVRNSGLASVADQVAEKLKNAVRSIGNVPRGA